MNDFSIDEQILSDRKSTYVIRATGKKPKHHINPGDFIVVDRNLPLAPDKVAVIIRKGKFTIDVTTKELIQNNDPENGDFIWGMVRAIVRELP